MDSNCWYRGAERWISAPPTIPEFVRLSAGGEWIRTFSSAMPRYRRQRGRLHSEMSGGSLDAPLQRYRFAEADECPGGESGANSCRPPFRRAGRQTASHRCQGVERDRREVRHVRSRMAPDRSGRNRARQCRRAACWRRPASAGFPGSWHRGSLRALRRVSTPLDFDAADSTFRRGLDGQARSAARPAVFWPTAAKARSPRPPTETKP
jgi:hypothetical protein